MSLKYSQKKHSFVLIEVLLCFVMVMSVSFYFVRELHDHYHKSVDQLFLPEIELHAQMRFAQLVEKIYEHTFTWDQLIKNEVSPIHEIITITLDKQYTRKFKQCIQLHQRKCKQDCAELSITLSYIALPGQKKLSEFSYTLFLKKKHDSNEIHENKT